MVGLGTDIADGASRRVPTPRELGFQAQVKATAAKVTPAVVNLAVKGYLRIVGDDGELYKVIDKDLNTPGN